MNRNLLLAAAAAACLTWPVAVLADPPTNNGGAAQDQTQKPAAGGEKGGEKGQDQGQKPVKMEPAGRGGQAMQGGGQPKGRAVAEAVPAGHGPATARVVQGAPASAQVPVMIPQPESQTHAERQTRIMDRQVQSGPGVGQRGGAGIAAAQAPAQQTQAAADRRQAFVRQSARPANVQVLAGWSRPAAGPARQQAGQQWRDANTGWDASARWRDDQNWWRGDAGFQLFGGVRAGFFFVPELGYVSAPAEYQSRSWNAGDQLPNWFWRYQIRDFWNYGLPQPPDGCAWVWVNNDVALMDASDGYILAIDHNAW